MRCMPPASRLPVTVTTERYVVATVIVKGDQAAGIDVKEGVSERHPNCEGGRDINPSEGAVEDQKARAAEGARGCGVARADVPDRVFYLSTTAAAQAPHAIHIDGFPKISTITIAHSATATMAGESIRITNTNVSGGVSVAVGAATNCTVQVSPPGKQPVN
eukprot:GILI01016399.1.p2 GENE.GILI01016399.1~~GILI01016399.1.p2  ORF type:complete len:161 (-),score=33.50 GILI01016399.1:70-552(-)